MTYNDVTQLQFLNFSTTEPGAYHEHRENAYKLWSHQWTETFKELNTSKKAYSDDFMDRMLGGLFNGTQPIGFMLYRHKDFTVGSTVDLEYFHNYAPPLIERHQKFGDKVMIISYLTTNPKWRKNATNYSIAELIFSLMSLTLIYSDSSRMLGYFRNNRKTNEAFYRHGGRFIERHSAYNVDVDFGELYKSQAQLSTIKDHAVMALKLWNDFLITKKGETNELTTSLKSQVNAATIG